jgi:N-acetylneuraminic acid mutarotase
MLKRYFMTALSLGVVACGPGEGQDEQPQHLTSVQQQQLLEQVGPLQVARSQHCSTRLQDGKVLFVGGFINGNHDVTATTEVYDPVSKTTSFRAPMNVARRGQECLRLQDGSLLVLGGVDDTSVIASAEKYNPATDTWTLLPPMPASNYGMAVAELSDGRILVAGGASYHSGSYLFNPTTNTWTSTGALNVGRTYPAAIKLADGRVLSVGGLGPDNNRRVLEVYSPATGTWSHLAPMLRDSGEPAAALLPDGRVFVGEMDDPNTSATAQVYDVATNTWSVLPPANHPHSWGARLTLAGGRPVVVGGGYGEQMPVERFDFAQNQWSVVGQLSVPRHGFTLDTLDDGSVLVTGGSQVNTNLPYTAMDVLTFATPPPSGTDPFSYSGSNTNSAQQNTTNRSFTLNQGDVLEVGTCNVPGASASGDTYLRLFNGATQVAFNDDSCGGASFIRYTAPTTGTYEVRAGCYSTASCGGTVAFRVIPSPTSPLSYSGSNTNSAQQATTNRSFTLNAGDVLEVGTCGVPGASASGDTFLRLFNGATATQVADNDDSCGTTASFIRYTAPTTGTYEVRAGCFAAASCSGTVAFRVIPSPTSPLTYSGSNTNSAQQNTTNRSFTLNAGDVLEVGTCTVPGSSATGDTYLRLFDGATQVAANDDACGGASYIQYTAPTTGTYEVRAGCYSSASCSGTVTFRITPAQP